MGALAHYLEQEGVPTTQVSLIREHSERIRPPRALWVSFPLGRPLGPPDQPEFQRRVLLAALRLLERASGPVLEDFPDDEPATPEMEGWACPVNLPAPPQPDGLLPAVVAEIERLRPWYELARERRGRTTFGASGLAAEDTARYLSGYLDDPAPPNPRPEVKPADLLKLASEDLKAFYFEAAAAQPGASGDRLADWFWAETAAGRLHFALQKRLLTLPDNALQLLGRMMLVPRSQAHRAN
ncbi:MAG: hypothetical protein FJX68_12015 [Alphaproteobacteria bacterium]|nr:hypothetical protein [Alphaproteobacteria bacterium]